MTRTKLISDLNRLLSEHAAMFPDAQEPPETGVSEADTEDVLMRVYRGELIPVSIRYLKAMVEFLGGPEDE